ncbi:MAG: ABC transporter substrate-binding protein [Candidatus Electrothrix sp.]
MKKIVLIFFICISCISIFSYSWWKLRNVPLEESVSIAVIGPLGLKNGTSMRNGVNLYIDDVNAHGGIDGRKVEVLFYDDENNSEKAEEIAREIAEDNKVLFVLGHYYDETSKAAGKIYRKFQIPAVTASASAEEIILNNKWYFRTISGNDMEARFVALYIKRGFKNNSVGIIFTQDSYGRSLAETFETMATGLGMRIAGKWACDIDAPSDEQLELIQKDLTEQPPEILYFATHAAEGTKIITALKDSNNISDQTRVIASYAFARSFLDKLKAHPKEQATPGYYSDGIYFVTPFMDSLGGVKAFEFASQYKEKYNKPYNIVSICYYDAAQVAIEAARKSGVQGKKHIREDRGKLRDALTEFYNAEKAVKGATGLIWFDKAGGMKKEYAVGVWQKGKGVPAAVQYAQQYRKIDNILQGILRDEIILIDDFVMSSTRVVSVGVQNFSVTNIVPDRSEFSASFQLNFSFSSPSRLNDNEIPLENMLLPLEFEDTVMPATLSNPITEKKTGKITTTTVQVQATFKADFDVASFPFNKEQKLAIRFRHKLYPYDRLVYIPQNDAIALGSPPDDWHLRKTSFFQDIMSKKTSLGNPNFFSSAYQLDYSRFNIECTVEQKNSFTMLFLHTLPLLLAGIGLFLIFYIPAERVEQRLIGLLVLLSLLVAFHLKQHARLAVGYLTVIDYAYYMLYLFILGSAATPLSVWRRRGKKPNPEHTQEK